MTTLLQTLSSDVPAFSLEVFFLVAGVVILILAIVAYLRAVALGDSVIEWLQDADEPPTIKSNSTDDILIVSGGKGYVYRPWSLPATKGIQRKTHLKEVPKSTDWQVH